MSESKETPGWLGQVVPVCVILVTAVIAAAAWKSTAAERIATNTRTSSRALQDIHSLDGRIDTLERGQVLSSKALLTTEELDSRIDDLERVQTLIVYKLDTLLSRTSKQEGR